jgi:TRAP-type C4-dicarboxylate transport system substrate-binding protein
MKRLLQATAAVVAMLGVATGAAQAKEMKMGLITPPPHIWTKEAQAFADALKKESDGRHSVVVYPSRQLGNEAEVLQQMQSGAVDFAFMTVAEISNRAPEFSALFTPFLVKDNAQAAKLLKTSPTAKGLLDMLPAKVGVVGVGYGMAGVRQIVSATPVKSIADLKGRKVRVTPFPATRDFNTILGTAPTPMPLPDVYDALSNGQVDAIEMDLELTIKLKYWELAKTVLISNQMMFPMVGIVSGRTWRDLSPSDRDLVTRLMRARLDAVLDQTEEIERTFLPKLKEKTSLEVLEVGQSFYGDALADWEKIWLPKAPAIPALRAEAKDL